MAGAGVALIVDSFLPWYVVRWTSRRFGGGHVSEHASTASAWASSTGWSAGIVLAVIAAAGWLLWPRRHSGRGRTAGAAVVASAAVVLTVGTWLTEIVIPDLEGGTYSFVPASGAGSHLGDIVRDSLASGSVTWGFHVGVALMLTIVACAFGARRHAPWT